MYSDRVRAVHVSPTLVGIWNAVASSVVAFLYKELIEIIIDHHWRLVGLTDLIQPTGVSFRIPPLKRNHWAPYNIDGQPS